MLSSQNQKNSSFFSTQVLFLSLFFLAFSQNKLAVITGVTISGVSGLLILLGAFFKPYSHLKFSNLLAGGTLLFTGLPVATTYTSGVWESNLEHYFITTSSVAQAHLFIILYSLFLLYGTKYLFFFFDNKYEFKQARTYQIILDQCSKISSEGKSFNVFIFFSFLLSTYQFYLLNTGQYGFLSQGWGDEYGNVNPIIQSVKSFIPTIFFLLGIFYRKIKLLFNYKSLKLIILLPLCCIVIIQFYWLFISASRTSFITSLVIYLFGLRFSYLDQPSNRWLPSIFLQGLSMSILSYSSFYFIAFFRFIVNKNFGGKLELHSPISVLLQIVNDYRLALETSNIIEFEEGLSNNVVTRGFVSGPFAMIMENSDTATFGQGQFLINNFLSSSPSSWFFDKTQLLRAEGFYYSHFKLPLAYTDLADSFYLAAFVDFSWLGIIILPIIISALFDIVLVINRKFNSEASSLLVISFLLPLSLFSGGEGTLDGFFTTLRNLVFFMFCAYYITSKKIKTYP
jgi:hypothetical protein